MLLKCYDKNVKCSKLEPGQLVRQKAFKGKHKIEDRWENIPFCVPERIHTSLPIYRVQKEGEKSKTKVLQQNLLFLLSLEKESEDTQLNDGNALSADNSLYENHWSAKESDIDIYQGPITQAKARKTNRDKVLLIVNALMIEHFGVWPEKSSKLL